MNPFSDYIFDFKMCRIPLGSKAPLDTGWQHNPVTALEDRYQYGLIHEHSGTCAIDIDDLELARGACAIRGIDIDWYLMTGVQISSGRPGHGKLIYRLPFPLPSKKVTYIDTNGHTRDYLNFRCMGNQDVLPPSIHPDTGMPYSWVGDHKNIPMLPECFSAWWAELMKPPKSIDMGSFTSNLPKVNHSKDDAQKLLNFCDYNTDRKNWVQVGMALKELSEDYFGMWDEWSARSADKYSGTTHNATQWRSFKPHPEGITGRSLEYYAKEGGWKPDLEAAMRLFAEETIDAGVIDEIEGLAAPEIPVEVLPKELLEYADEVAYSIGANITVPVASGLIAIAAVANAQTRLKIQEGFKVPPIIWGLTIGSPAAKKSPAATPMMSVFRKLEQEDIPRFKQELLRFEALEASYVQGKKNYLEMAKDAEFLIGGQDTDVLIKPPPEPVMPTSLRFTVGDTSSQKLVDLVVPRPEGMTLVLDEGASWIEKMCSPRSTDDRSMWTVSYEGQPYSFDRVTRGSMMVDNLAISAYMNIQPNVLSEYMEALQKDGLLQRFIPFVIPDRNSSFVSNPIPEYISAKPNWENVLRRIHATGEREYYLGFEAHAEFKEFEKWVEDMKNTHAISRSHPGFQSTLGKFTGLCGRIILLFHLGNDPQCVEVPLIRVKEAITFMKNFVYPSNHHMYFVSGGVASFDRWVFDWIITGDEEIFTDSQVRRSARRQLEGIRIYEQKDMVTGVLDYLATKNVILEIDSEDTRVSKFAVNPLLRKTFYGRRQEVVKAKQRIIDNAVEIAEANTDKPVTRRYARGTEHKK